MEVSVRRLHAISADNDSRHRNHWLCLYNAVVALRKRTDVVVDRILLCYLCTCRRGKGVTEWPHEVFPSQPTTSRSPIAQSPHKHHRDTAAIVVEKHANF